MSNLDIQQQIKELREQLNKLEQQQCCHDWEVFACGCKRCKKCGQIIRDYSSFTWTYRDGTSNFIPLGSSWWT